MECVFTAKWVDDGRNKISFNVDGIAARARLARVRKAADEKYGGYVTVSVRLPYRPRTTGDGSQNHHLNGHIVQICNETGNDYETVKAAVKMLAVEASGYPFKTFHGTIVPKRERDCDTEECAKLIDAAHMLAADLGITLRER